MPSYQFGVWRSPVARLLWEPIPGALYFVVCPAFPSEVAQRVRRSILTFAPVSVPKRAHSASAEPGERQEDRTSDTELHQAAKAKSASLSAAVKAETMLAIDANHAGHLSMSTIVDRYRELYPDVRAEFGFREIRLVGSTDSTTTRLG